MRKPASILTILAAAATFANATIIADGRGFFPVMVQVVDAVSGTPIKGAEVRLEGAGNYREQELDPERQTKALPESLGKPVTTNAVGVAVVFYYGAWSSMATDGKTTYTAPLVGTVVVKHHGKEIYRSTLEAWAKDKQFKLGESTVPWIVVSPPAPK